jgi:hypothetical protein
MAMPNKKYKIILHFEHQDKFLDGFFVVVESTDAITALKEILDYNRYITTWKGKTVCINFKNIFYAECEEVNYD